MPTVVTGRHAGLSADAMNDARTVKGFLVGLVVAGPVAFFVISSKQPAPAPAPAPAMPPMAAPAFAPPQPAPSQPASPREAADELFNVAMMASEKNDQATLAQALPQAIAAYRALGSLDGDATYHLAALELTGGRDAEARATCATLLTANPNHLLALGISMQAAERAGDAMARRDFAERLMKGYDAEAVRQLPEYRDHQRMLPNYRADAMAALK